VEEMLIRIVHAWRNEAQHEFPGRKVPFVGDAVTCFTSMWNTSAVRASVRTRRRLVPPCTGLELLACDRSAFNISETQGLLIAPYASYALLP
jgi:hypothetical protein